MVESKKRTRQIDLRSVISVFSTSMLLTSDFVVVFVDLKRRPPWKQRKRRDVMIVMTLLENNARIAKSQNAKRIRLFTASDGCCVQNRSLHKYLHKCLHQTATCPPRTRTDKKYRRITIPRVYFRSVSSRCPSLGFALLYKVQLKLVNEARANTY